MSTYACANILLASYQTYIYQVFFASSAWLFLYLLRRHFAPPTSWADWRISRGAHELWPRYVESHRCYV